MVAIIEDDGTARVPGCAPRLYKGLQTKWTGTLMWQMGLYVVFLAVTMAAGGLMPWILQRSGSKWGLPPNALWRQQLNEQYDYNSNNTYSFCPATPVVDYFPLQQGYPRPPLYVKDGQLRDAWRQELVTLRGLSWFGFNNQQGFVDGLWVGGSGAATDFHSIGHQLKLLGFNAVRLPFTFDVLQAPGKDQAAACTPATLPQLAKHATDPAAAPQPDFSSAPQQSIYLGAPPELQEVCNTYIPSNTTIAMTRLLWAVQYYVANGFYVVLDYHPAPSDPLALDPPAYATAWLRLWATLTCLPNFSSSLRHRVLLDLLNEPGKLAGGGGLRWAREGPNPGLEELYLTTMDALERLTPGDPLYLVQGAGRGGAAGLAPGDGFVTDKAAAAAYGLSDASPFFDALLTRTYSTRVLLAPHLYGPTVNAGAASLTGADLYSRLDASWGGLLRDGYCTKHACQQFAVVAGEIGSSLKDPADQSYYKDLAPYLTQPRPASSSATAAAKDRAAPNAAAVPSGWFWWAYNANSNITGGLVTDDWSTFDWSKIRYLVSSLGLQPWYKDPTAFVNSQATAQQDSIKAAQAAKQAAAAAAAAKAAAGVSADNTTETIGQDLDLSSFVVYTGPSSGAPKVTIGPVIVVAPTTASSSSSSSEAATPAATPEVVATPATAPAAAPSTPAATPVSTPTAAPATVAAAVPTTAAPSVPAVTPVVAASAPAAGAASSSTPAASSSTAAAVPA